MMQLSPTIPTLFLLGGYDLEMITIRKLLEEKGFIEIQKPEQATARCFADKQLTWGATLSQYSEFLNLNSARIYGIELTEDTPPPAHYTRIDHHNDFAHKPSSIEQIAALLQTDLNRFQQLIAANDKGYIPAMKAMNATEEDIDLIRRADRKAQGVTAEDEWLAEESIDSNSRLDAGLLIVKALTDKFSPITDRLYGQSEKLLIYTDKKLVYYGKSAAVVARHFGKLIQEHKAYTGGGNDGYFGLVEGAFRKEEIEDEIINRTKNIVENE